MALDVDALDYEEATKIYLSDDLSGGHPMLGHPVDGVPESAQSPTPLSCTSCHAPHASSFARLLLGDLELCARCHS